MTNLSRKELVMGYYTKGSSCVKDAAFLFKNNHWQCYDVLLLNGLELLFKSFILLKDGSIENDDLKKYGHNYLKAYRRCLELDDEKTISNGEFKNQLEFLYNFWEPDPIKSRYAERRGLRHFPKDIFIGAEKNIINPMFALVNDHYKSFDK